MRNTTYTWDDVEKKLYVHHTEDVEPILEENNAARNDGTNGYSKSRLWRKIGTIPNLIIEQVLREKGINLLDGSEESAKYCRKLLKSNYKLMTVDKL